jgi:cell division protein FtsQ
MTSSIRSRRMRRPEPEPEEDLEPRRRAVSRRLIVIMSVITMLAIGYLIVFTSLFGVKSVEVSGATTIPAETIRAAAAIEDGTPLVRLDTDEVRARVAALPKVFSAEVTRSFPNTVEIAIVERGPVAMITAADGVHLVDSTGLDYEIVKAPPQVLPELVVDAARPDDPATASAVSILTAIPQQLRAQLVRVTAKTPGNVQLTLADGRLIKWGSAENSARKAAVLAPLLTRPGKVYDVATPDFPTVA